MKILYTKHNYHRLPQFQTVTSILEETEQRKVVKRALTSEARKHIDRIFREQEHVAGFVDSSVMKLPEWRQRADGSIEVDFIQGASLDSFLYQAFLAADRARYLSLLTEYIQRLRAGFKTREKIPEMGQEEIERIFGSADFPWVTPHPGAFMPCVAVDCIFENLIVAGDLWTLVDNEWFFPGYIPVDYIIYRALFFHDLKWHDFGLKKIISFEDAARHCGIPRNALSACQEIEEHFQAFIHGTDRPLFRKHYHKAVNTITGLQQHIAGLQQHIAGQQRELAEIKNSHSYRWARQVCQKIDYCLPPGSRWRAKIASIGQKMAKIIKTRQPPTQVD